MNAPNLPGSLIENPRLDRWIHFATDRTVRVATGKVEIGQGVVTALGQIAADELDLPLDRVRILSGDTTHGPDEMYTTSSLSIPSSTSGKRASVTGQTILLFCAHPAINPKETSARSTRRTWRRTPLLLMAFAYS